MSNQGTIVQIIGAVIDADFSKASKLPEIFNALEIHYVLNEVQTKLVLEVQQHLGDGWVRAVAMSTTDGLKRGMTLVDTGKAIAVPVGKQVLGRIFSVTVKPKVFKKLEDAQANFPMWVAAIAGKLGEATDKGFILADPNIQVFEKKPKEPKPAPSESLS
jgi:F-type H+-transporting ATPase subunit beta